MEDHLNLWMQRKLSSTPLTLSFKISQLSSFLEITQLEMYILKGNEYVFQNPYKRTAQYSNNVLLHINSANTVMLACFKSRIELNS